ncbi:MAG: hypothetical protein JZU65_16640 [Chlorobium sp.]|nr:hypothetical protein [Chlorobium sp.]
MWGQQDWVVFSNSDVSFPSQILRDHLKDLPQIAKIGVWGPEILSASTDSNQNPFLLNRPTRAKMIFYSSLYQFPTMLYCYEILSNVKKRLFRSAQQRALAETTKQPGISKVYAVHGSFFVLSKEFIENVRNVQWPCFLYGEEIWFAEMCNKYKLGIYYDPNFRVNHLEHTTTSYLSTKNKAKNHFQSIKYLLNTFWK